MPGSVTVEPYFGLEVRLIRVESEIADLKELLRAALKGVLIRFKRNLTSEIFSAL
jgi:hypothetical protein